MSGEVLRNEVREISVPTYSTPPTDLLKMYWRTLKTKLQMPTTPVKLTVIVVGGGAAGIGGEPLPTLLCKISLNY